eukprot:3551082-Pleurochrysis_carterae.AAC.2
MSRCAASLLRVWRISVARREQLLRRRLRVRRSARGRLAALALERLGRGLTPRARERRVRVARRLEEPALRRTTDVRARDEDAKCGMVWDSE